MKRFRRCTNPSTWWKIQCARAEIASFLNTLPGINALIGGFWFFITLTCTDDVCVLNRISGFFVIKKVSCISLAGCSGGKFNAENTCQSSSTSGPSSTTKPNLLNIDDISLLTNDIG